MPTNEYNRTRYRIRKEAGLCTRCSNHVSDGHPFCLDCRKKHNIRTKLRRTNLDAKECCRSCAAVKERKNRTYCNSCLEKRRLAKEDKIIQRLQAAQCQDCGVPEQRGRCVI